MEENKTLTGTKELLEKRIELLEKKLNIKTAEVEKLKARFLSNISHEIRTPMNAIMGFSCLLKDASLSKDEKDFYLEAILKSSENLMRIIENIIQAARIESNDVEILDQEVQVNTLIKEMLNKFEALKKDLGKQHIEFRFLERSNQKELSIKTDAVKLQHILHNLIENALKFTNEGFIEVGYKLKGPGKIEFYVKDSGIGIPNQKLSTVFDKFTQAECNSKKKHSGIGIGLSISKNLTEVLGGKMDVISAEGMGSTFSFTLPLKIIPLHNFSDNLYQRFSNTWPEHHYKSISNSTNYWKKNISVHSKNFKVV